MNLRSGGKKVTNYRNKRATKRAAQTDEAYIQRLLDHCR